MSASEAAELYAYGPVAYVCVFLFGTLWGSFANVCIYRMPPTDEHPRGRSVVRPGSHCSACSKPVRWYDNMPMLSYALLRGRCRDCGAEFSPRYLLVEVATGILFTAVYHHALAMAYQDELISVRLLRFAVLAAFVTVLIIITFIDLDTGLILDKITYPAVPVFYLLGLILPGSVWWHGLVGAAFGYGLIRVIADGWQMITKRHGMGYGDGKLLAVVGALMGWQAVLVALFAGSLIGTVIGVPLILIKGRPQATNAHTAADAPIGHVALPFGPFLALGAMAYIFVAPWIEVSMGLLWA